MAQAYAKTKVKVSLYGKIYLICIIREREANISLAIPQNHEKKELLESLTKAMAKQRHDFKADFP